MLHPMSAVQAIILIGGSFLLLAVMIAFMVRANESERRIMQRRHQEWIANGSIPEEKPNFYTGHGGSGN